MSLTIFMYVLVAEFYFDLDTIKMVFKLSDTDLICDYRITN